MKTKIIIFRTIILICVSIIIAQTNLKAQVFTGFKAFSQLIEYEGQRYLMENIYQITTNDFDKLKIDKTIKEVDTDEGFMFVLTSYIFNGNSGIVITSFNSTNFSNTQHLFTNVHLTDKQYRELYNTFIILAKNTPTFYEHFLKKYSERLIADVNYTDGGIYYTLWVDYHNRHTFTKAKWDRAFKRYEKFITK